MSELHMNFLKRLIGIQSETQPGNIAMELLHNKESVHDWEPIKWKVTSCRKITSIIEPKSKNKKYAIPGGLTYEKVPFEIENRHYPDINALTSQVQWEDVWCRNDCGIPDVVAVYRCHYGTTVMYISEHFLCYDRYDRLYDKRFDHYYYVFDGERLSLLHYADTGESFYVTENVDKIHWLHLRKMKHYSVFPFIITP